MVSGSVKGNCNAASRACHALPEDLPLLVHRGGAPLTEAIGMGVAN